MGKGFAGSKREGTACGAALPRLAVDASRSFRVATPNCRDAIATYRPGMDKRGRLSSRSIMRRLATVALCLAATALCLGLSTVTARAAGYVPALISDYLPNPGIGFQAMNNLGNPVLPETVAYRRPQYAWKDQNPLEGVYDWSAVDADLAAAVALGKQFSFRIYTMRGEIFGGHQVPQWVLNKGAEISGGEPVYSNCVYQQEWSNFVEAMRLRYDGNPDIAFIDISGYGNFNEWSWQSQTEWDSDFMNPATLDGMARKRLADMFIGGSGTIQCRLAGGTQQQVAYSYTGFQQTQLLMPYAGVQQSTRYVSARRADVGIRHDCLGSRSHTDGMLSKIGDVIDLTWPNAPIGYELCGPENMSDALAVLQTTHGSIVHENNGGNDIVELSDTLRYAGYRFAPTYVNHETAVAPTGALHLEMSWQNIGFAPAYAAMGQSFELYFYLLDGNADVAASWLLATDVNAWMPADPIATTPPDQAISQTLALPGAFPTGIYTAAVAIMDTRSGLPILLSIDGRDANGRYQLASVNVTNGEICGDGVLNTGVGEQCDDGNTISGDCCSATCQFETGTCDDGDACSTADTCNAGVCVGGPPADCNDAVACTVDSCDPVSGCANTPDDALCDDAIVCTQDVCNAVSGCANTPSDLLCDDGDLCTDDVCDPATLLCSNDASPATGCRIGSRAKFSISAKNGRNKLTFNMSRLDTPGSALGDPTVDGGTGYALCVYDGPGVTAQLEMSANLPAGVNCGGKSCWKLKKGQAKYKQSTLAPDGVKSAKISSGKAGRDKIKLKGQGDLLSLPVPASANQYFPLVDPLTVQTINSDGQCWQAEFNANSASKNDGERFKASVR